MVFIIFIFVFLIPFPSISIPIELLTAYQDIITRFDLIHPLPSSQIQLQPHHHHKRCKNLSPHSNIEDYLKDSWLKYSHGRKIFVTSPCLGSDSLGNMLSNYFENLICSKKVGLDFVAVGNIWEPKTNHQPSPFLSSLPYLVPQDNPTISRNLSKEILRKTCLCHENCHEKIKALWPTEISYIHSILHQSIQHHLLVSNISLQTSFTEVSPKDQSTLPTNSKLPLIPEVSIHYRCGDNFVGSYGFLPFHAFSKLIPTNVKTIFVLAEKTDRKTIGKEHLQKKCKSIFASLFQYLKFHFPSSNILIRRGDDLYLDFIRLSLSPITICSVSTFCLWPAIAHSKEGIAYFPRTPLVLQGSSTRDLGPHFHWLEGPEFSVVLGEPHQHTPPEKFIKLLNPT